MTGFRIEEDFLGTKQIPSGALYGINAVRATENFSHFSAFPMEWYKAIGGVKLAYYKAYKIFKENLLIKYPSIENTFAIIPEAKLHALIATAQELYYHGAWFDNFIVPGISGGAGTSINMNINEIIANASLQKLGEDVGNYSVINPVEHANIYQSTNDVIPSSLKLAIMFLLDTFELALNENRIAIEYIEKKYLNTLRIGYTEMQEAVPTSFGKLFGSYLEAFARDWWRISKCFERIKVVNLGGSAAGTGLTVPRFIIFSVCDELKKITNKPITRAEHLPDATANFDSFVEVHAILKAHAVNLEKFCSDIRLLSSDLCGNILTIPAKQVGSSIMPGKVNPVICEYVISLCHRIYANDSIITSGCAAGCLELNPYLPSIGIAIIDSLKMLIAANKSITQNLVAGLSVNNKYNEELLYNSPVIVTALLPLVGYNKANDIAKSMQANKLNVFQACEQFTELSQGKVKQLLSKEKLLELGFVFQDLI